VGHDAAVPDSVMPDTAMSDTVKAATLVGPFDLRVERYPRPDRLEPGAVLLQMLASGICGTDKHTFRGETEQYVGTDHARSTPFPIIQGHENVGVVVDLGPGGARTFDGSPLTVGDRVVPAPNRACGRCGPCTERQLPVLLLRAPRELRQLAVVRATTTPLRRMGRTALPPPRHTDLPGA
jgi:Zn-dependent alcohol dehydrogenase